VEVVKTKVPFKESSQMLLLRDILFEKDREQQLGLNERVGKIQETLNTKEKLSAKVNPLIKEELDQLKNDFPTLFGPVITETIKYQIQNSQDEVVDALYPIIGRLIRKYISREIEILSERVDKQFEKAFSWQGWLIRIKTWFGGANESDIVLQGISDATIEEIFVIEQNSGLLFGSYSRTKTIDEDMIAGMLTAIKSFVVDAFKTEDQNLEGIEYESYHILFYNFNKFFLTVVVSGITTASFKDQLEKTVLKFVDKLRKQSNNIEESESNQFSGYLEKFFKDL